MTPEEKEYLASRPPAFWKSLERYNQDIRELVREDSKQGGSSLSLDLSFLPPDRQSLFIDVVHLSNAGQDRVAEYAAALVLADLEQRALDQAVQKDQTTRPTHR